MAKGARSLRFASAADMPAGMARLLQQQEQRDNAQRSRLVTVLKTTAVGKSEAQVARAPSLAEVLLGAADAAAADVAFQPTPEKPARKSKYGAVATWVDGIRFDSKREAEYYKGLKLRVAAGEVAFFTRQTPIHLPGGTKLVVDFVEYSPAPDTPGAFRVRWVDVKGRETAVFRLKKREVEHHYPHIRIELA